MTDISHSQDPVHPEPRFVDQSGQSLWIRALFMLGFGLIAYVALWILFFLGLLQLVVYLINRAPNDDLRLICRELIGYLAVVLGYMTFVRDEKPFPFSPFPKGTAL